MATKTETQIAPRILIVDDDADIRGVYSHLLEASGYKALTAADGKEALEMIRTQAIDLILLDLMMPVMDGFATLDVLHKQTGSKSIPVIILSAMGDKESVVRGLTHGAVDYIHKGCDADEILARVQVHLTLQKWRQKALQDYGDMIKKQMEEKYRIY